MASKVPTVSVSLFCCSVDVLRKEVQRFYQIEDVKTKNNFSIEEKACEASYTKNVKRDSQGRYSVALPIKSNISNLNNNKTNALNQFYNLEKKLTANPELKQLYCQFMDEYASLNHMQLAEQPEADVSYFLPHHAVFKENSTTKKLRVVFNGSSKSSSGLSLNDTLMTGPTIQPELFSILIRFRKFKVALSADITKMYRQINILPKYHHLQQIWWRSSPESPLAVYQLKTVTYGTTSAPFLAIRTLKQLAIDEHQHFIKVSQNLLQDFYVDDFLGGANDSAEANIIKSELTALLAKGGFELTKWSSNDKNVVPIWDQPLNNVVTTLGIVWNTLQDTLKISIGKHTQHYQPSDNLNKRMVLSQTSQIFDPLGLCAPAVFIAKLFLQKLWAIPNLNWDNEVPEPYRSEWMRYSSQFPLLSNISVPRSIIQSSKYIRIELHGFGDASESGYGCCIYIRTLNSKGNYHCQLLCSKSRVAPLKTQTIPRLELCAALLLSQLYEKVQQSIQIKFDKVKLWSDSEITLFRINSSPAKYATFVANRVSQIQDIAPPELWSHIPSELNPADLVSRGMMPADLKNCNLWWKGPPFLLEAEDSWTIPRVKFTPSNDIEYIKSHALLAVPTQKNYLIQRYSDLNKLLRIAALCLRYYHNTKSTVENRWCNELSSEEIENALKGLIKAVQSEVFGIEINQLKSNKLIKKHSSIFKLNPFIDDCGILRVGGRLANSLLPFDQKHPMLLPLNHNFTTMLARKEHSRNLHAGPQALLYCLRQRFWIIGGRKLCKTIVHNCILCFRTKPKSITQIMGQLPRDRVTPSRAFEHVGIDYCGPFNLRQPFRSNITTKAFIAVFICFTTKASHLEVVHDLSTQGFLAALRRFVSRRGRCANIFSDNATNFIGAQTELKELKRIFDSDSHKHEILKYCTEEGINWRTIPPRSPHFGGLWEAAVKSAKYHLKRSIKDIKCTFEDLTTLVTQIEACLNSRPLSPMSSDPSDMSVLTPGHFLIGGPINAIPEPSLCHLKFNRLSIYQRLQYCLQQFWKRWSAEYLTELQQRHKWVNPSANVEVGNLVLLKEDNLPPMKWIMGRIVNTHSGSDNYIRVVTIKTTTGEFKRAISKICVLPIETQLLDHDDSIDESSGFRGFE